MLNAAAHPASKASACLIASFLLSGCPFGEGTPSPTPIITETPAPTATAAPTATNPDEGTPTQTPIPPSPTAPSPTPTALPPTPTATPDLTPTPAAPCIPPEEGDAVCLDVGANIYLVDGIVVEPTDVTREELPYFGTLDASFVGIDNLSLENASITEEGSPPGTVDIGSLDFTASANTTTTLEGDGTLTVTAVDADSPFGISIDVSTTQAFGSGWALGRMGGINPGYSQTYTFLDIPGVLVATQEITGEGENASYSAHWEDGYGTECDVRLYLDGALVTTLSESCQDISYDILGSAGGARAVPSGGGDLPPLGMQEFDVAESKGKIRYTFTGSSGYDFDLP